MAASRSMLEALLARVQKRAQEPRAAGVHIPPLPPLSVASVESAAAHDGADTVPPQAPVDAGYRTQPPVPALVEVPSEDEDIEEYDEELIEIIDDADVIPQAAAAARAIEPSAYGATLERRGAVPNGKSAAPVAVAAVRAPAAPPALTPALTPAQGPAPTHAVAHADAAEPLRPEAVAPRPVASNAVVQARGARRELRAVPFLELLDASLKLGG